MPRQFSFSKEYRLRKKKDFEYVFEKGKRFSGKGLVCYWFSDEVSGNKLGIVVSKKVGQSVERNRIKRYIREYYRLNRPRFLKSGTLIVVARPEVSNWDHQQIDAELEQLLKTAEILDG
ncbi:MAG TPA: ribonuclease P protein component [Candidatus Hydrogenedens sp.]|nr:ribonuclease P protein component [Candidatus Hydrogenedens sp.]HOK08918.1 ribonuclease P protein component [Candidatus Hydrogenedens sp.]HOL19597.1 ribonuclease P protein component [Candidatus Hydrogenedens sp.]HPP58879.1 ribonuclease P protein component [Candidatus Hydrogenedens sp.]